MSLREEKKKEKSEVIRQAAFRLFEERGYAGTKIIDIAKASGIAKGTFYEYYSGKLEILEEWLNKIFQDFEKSLDETIDGFTGDSERDMATVSESIRKNIRLIDLNFMLIFNSMEVSDPAEREKVRKMASDAILREFARMRSDIVARIEAGQIRGAGCENLVTLIIIMSFMMFNKIKNAPKNDLRNSVMAEVQAEAEHWNLNALLDFLFNGIGAGRGCSKTAEEQ